MWTWLSIPPGMAISLSASITCVPPSRAAASAVIVPSEMPMSQVVTPAAVTTRAPLMIVSNLMRPPPWR